MVAHTADTPAPKGVPHEELDPALVAAVDKIHSKAIGTEPYSGQPYDANDPASQLWIHLTAWHSILYAYEKYGPLWLKLAFRVIHLNRRAELLLLQLLSPMTFPVVRPILLEVPPVTREVVSPHDARGRYGFDKPAEAHLSLRAKQHSRVFGEGAAPSDVGLLESQDILGSLG
ncbi:oxygenase MpaB family protein [Nocardia acididurans]|uniref:oxygenase MpaB family protein n=1 Tax=Nocardia acididurans TaxID=2802282 RepID=UPI001E4A8F89|nr:oxygenase MpaB family protein [Nocardia acididurans]